MRYQLEEYGKFVEITSYRNIHFDQVETYLKTNRKLPQSVAVQFFDADLIATQEHLYFATLNALQAFKEKTNISKSLAMETMLYASAQRQIQKAIDRTGIKPDTCCMAVLILGDNNELVQSMLDSVTACVGSQPDETALDITETKEKKIKKAFKITKKETENIRKGCGTKSLVDLLIERFALLATQL